MKKIILCLSILLLLYSCSDASFYSSDDSTTDVHAGTILNDDAENQRFKSESELERERLDKEYRQTEYLEGYEETHDRLETELRAILVDYFDEHVTTEYAFSTELKFTNLGYQLAKEKNLNLMTIVKEFPENILKLEYYLIGYVDKMDSSLETREAILKYNDFLPQEAGLALYEYFDRHLVETVRPLPSDLISLKEEFENSDQDVLEFHYKYYFDNADDLKYLFNIDGNLVTQLREKYKEDFVRVKSEYIDFEQNTLGMYAPLRNIDIMFNSNGYDDKYRASIFQYLMAERMEEILDRYNMRDRIGYFVAAENHDNKGNTSGIEFTQSQLSKMTDTLNLTLYYMVDEGEEEELDVLVDMLRDIYRDTDKVRLINVVIYFYELSERDQGIALKLLDEAKLSQNVLYDDSGMENWGQYIHRTRNDSDAFKFLDNFGIARDYLYHINYYVDENYTFEYLLTDKKESRFD